LHIAAVPDIDRRRRRSAFIPLSCGRFGLWRGAACRRRPRNGGKLLAPGAPEAAPPPSPYQSV